MIVDFQSNGSTIPTFPKSSTTLVESFSASRHRKKNSNYCSSNCLFNIFCLFCPQKKYHQLFHYILLSLMFSHVSVCLSIFPFFIQRWPPIESSWPRPCCSGRGSPKSASFASGEAERRNTKKMEKRELLCGTVGEYEKLTLVISFVILCIFRSLDIFKLLKVQRCSALSYT